jgi:hypothetical protein
MLHNLTRSDWGHGFLRVSSSCTLFSEVRYDIGHPRVQENTPLGVYTVTSLWYTILLSLAAGDGIHDRPEYQERHALQSKTIEDN